MPLHEGIDVASVPVNPSNQGMASVPISPNEGTQLIYVKHSKGHVILVAIGHRKGDVACAHQYQ